LIRSQQQYCGGQLPESEPDHRGCADKAACARGIKTYDG